MKIAIEPHSRITLSPCDLVENTQGLILKRGANLIVFKNKNQILAVKLLFEVLSEEQSYEFIRNLFLKFHEKKLFNEIITLLLNNHFISINTNFSEFSDAEMLFFEQLGVSVHDFQKILSEQKVLLLGSTPILDEFAALYKKYEKENICFESAEFINLHEHINEEKPMTIIAIGVNGQVDKLLLLNSIVKKRNIRFLPIVLRDAFCHIGPSVNFDYGPCFECSLQRYDANHSILADIYNKTQSPVYALTEHASKFIAAIVFQQYIYMVTNKINICSNSIIEANINSFSLQRRSVLISPGCSTCH